MAVPEKLTPEKLATMPPQTLAELANNAGEAARKAAQKSICHGLTAGDALNAAKNQIKHGDWQAWVKINWNYSHRWATTLMRLSANWNSTSNLENAETITQALAMLSETKETESEPKPELIAEQPHVAEEPPQDRPAKPAKKAERKDSEPYSIDDMEREIRRAIDGWFRKVPDTQYDELHGTIIEQLNERWVVR